MIKKVVGIYFSPVGGTAKMTKSLASGIADSLRESCPVDVTYETLNLVAIKDQNYRLDDETVAVIGLPVYIGKVPIPAVELLKNIEPNGAMSVATVSYGGRTYGNALYELQHETENIGFKTVGAGAFSVKSIKTRKRPTGMDIDNQSLGKFCSAVSSKIKRLAGCEIEGLRVKPAPVDVSGKLPVHGISKISPKAAAKAQELIERMDLNHKDSEWFL